ncbi:Protein of uncharacterised function (DUF1602) [Bordetella pertussis]|nr:Protein of uncharacterised function (DUF1602) [Bordetella pertussis]
MASSKVRPCAKARTSSSTRACVAASRWAAGSSSRISPGSRRNRRASATRCACPPDRPWPRLPSGVSRPRGKACANSMTQARRAASSTSAALAPGRARRMLSAIEPAYR